MKKQKYEAVVVGGGLAGICAAIAAARLGVKVALIQDRPVLGGNSSTEIRVPPKGAGFFNAWAHETGIIHELLIEERHRNYSSSYSGNSMWELVLYEWIKREKNITLFLDTSVRDVKMKNKSEIKSVSAVQLATEKEFEIEGKLFVDATGDGTVAYKAGARYRLGREAKSEFNESIAPEKADSQTMGNSLLFHATKLDHPVKFEPPEWIIEYPTDESLYKRDHTNISGGGGYWWIEIGGGNFNIIFDNEILRDELLRHLLGVWDHIKNHGNHGAENYLLDWVGMVPGKRESRRFIGDYILNQNDVRNATVFEDRVAYGGWFIDLHVMGGILTKNKAPEPLCGNSKLYDELGVDPYSIPYRCLYSKDVDNLFLAGRDISVTHVALGTTRVMNTCAVIGQAVGTALAFCKKYNLSPREVGKKHISQLQQSLLKQDCYIPYLANSDPDDLAKTAKITASSTAPLEFKEGEKSKELTQDYAQLFPLTSNKLDSMKLFLKSELENKTKIKLYLRKAKNIWDFTSTENIATSEATIPPKSRSWVKFPFNINLISDRGLYWICIEPKQGISWCYSDNVPVGTVAARKPVDCKKWWTNTRIAFSLILDPISKPYGAENVNNGVSRPECWTNIWISDHYEGLPQFLEIDFGSEKKFDTVYLTFDTNLDREPHRDPPECVRDYELSYFESGRWVSILKEKGITTGEEFTNFRLLFLQNSD